MTVLLLLMLVRLDGVGVVATGESGDVGVVVLVKVVM